MRRLGNAMQGTLAQILARKISGYGTLGPRTWSSLLRGLSFEIHPKTRPLYNGVL